MLSSERRGQLLQWAADRDALVLEDDFDAEFRFDRVPTACLQGMDPSRTLLLGSVSKTLAPALRLGWVVAPPQLLSAVRHPDGEARVYAVRGALFFASSNDLVGQFDYAGDPPNVIIDLSESQIYDSSTVAALDSIELTTDVRPA